VAARRGGGPIEVASLREQVYDRIKGLILDGKLAAGERVSPAELAERFGVSTMPVREALRLLEEDGFIETSARRWTRVAAPDPSLADEIYPLIGVLEEFALASGRRADEATLAKLASANETLRAAAAGPDVVACMHADGTFHDVAIGLSENATLIHQVTALKGRIRLLEGAYFRLDEADASLAEHAAVIEALAAGKNAEAGKWLRRNWIRSGESHSRSRKSRTPEGKRGRG
jgi:DNA-binding GntR family transcriptional regulator